MKGRCTMRCVLFAVLLVVGCATGAVAGPAEDAYSTYERGDYALAARLLRPLAEQGIAEAQVRLGFMYGQGQGVPKDYQEAAKWTRRAAENADTLQIMQARNFTGTGPANPEVWITK